MVSFSSRVASPDLTLSLMFGPGNGSSSIFTGAGGYALSVDASGFDAGFFLGASGSESGSVAGFFWLGVAGCRWVSLGVAGSVWFATLLLGVSTGIPSDTSASPPEPAKSDTGRSPSPMDPSPTDARTWACHHSSQLVVTHQCWAGSHGLASLKSSTRWVS